MSVLQAKRRFEAYAHRGGVHSMIKTLQAMLSPQDQKLETDCTTLSSFSLRRIPLAGPKKTLNYRIELSGPECYKTRHCDSVEIAETSEMT